MSAPVIQYDKLLLGMSNAALTTLSIFALTMLFAVPLGFCVAFGRMSRFKAISLPVKLFLLVVRGTPLMLQLVFVYFAPSYIINAMTGEFPNMPSNYRFIATIIAFSLNYAAYFSEIFRGGIESIHIGQREAAKVLGFTRVQTFFRVILPQVIKRILPPMCNETITLVKDTALAQVLAVAELFTYGKNQMSGLVSLMPLVIAGVFYLAMNLVVTVFYSSLEKKLSYYR